MSSRYWGALFAAIGLASTAFCLGAYVVALNKPHEERYQPYRYAADKPRDIDPALENKADAQPLEYREPCKEPKGRDESDLCAQWRAAKAGEQSAFWAKWGFGITALGIFGLIATIIQSRIALDRAREANTIAQDTAKDARRIGAAQAAGYLHVVPGSFIEFMEPLWHVAGRLRVKNTGASPAEHVKLTVRILSEDWTVIDNSHASHWITADCDIVPVGETPELTMIWDPVIPEVVSALHNGEHCVILEGKLSWTDRFDYGYSIKFQTTGKLDLANPLRAVFMDVRHMNDDSDPK